MAAPYEIITQPLTVYVAPVGSAFPEIDSDIILAPTGDWLMLGTCGDKNYEDEGVTVAQEQTVNLFRGAGAAGPRKAWRAEEDFIISFTLVDLSPEQYATVMNDAAVETVAPGPDQAGTKSHQLSQGLLVNSFALLARGISPVNETLNAQYEVLNAVQDGNPSPVWGKGAAAGLEVSFRALEDCTNGFGVFRSQTDPAS